ncbi:hypothetical protein GWI33_023312 [Rhynchophorus ferrugineus]|uniref:Uncharacterized protein n=1 Tax=Rhynchophorus ferrugineus TaxID=354439 RepID=A0A834HP60_RHYFE|nr:hypothetical protein GWI33_023312 [Rhynchophorus ferrugineus]
MVKVTVEAGQVREKTTPGPASTLPSSPPMTHAKNYRDPRELRGEGRQAVPRLTERSSSGAWRDGGTW